MTMTSILYSINKCIYAYIIMRSGRKQAKSLENLFFFAVINIIYLI
jgi:hypothetical protein